MEKWKKRSINLLFSLIFGGNGDFSVVPYYPQKTRVAAYEMPFFRRSAPERHGISSKRLYNMLCSLEAEKRANIHSLMVIADGEVICQCSVDGYDVGCWQVSHSMAKTVCGMVIGALVGDGRLSVDRRITDIFPEITYRDKKFAQITVHHLLSMTAGVDFAEAGSVTENNWTSAYFSSTVRFTPGSRFAYNSMNTYILARAAERVTGISFKRLADEKIFAPMGISSYLWEMGPEGCEKAGWGLYMSPESWGKLGYMIMCGGEFMGQRILPKDWVELCTSTQAVTPEFNGGFNYGYQMWVSRKGREILFSGMLGQNVWINPQNELVVVMTGGNNELFQASPALEIIRSYLGGKIEDRLNRRDIALLREKEATFFKCRRWIIPKERNNRLFSLLGIRMPDFADIELKNICGSYEFPNNNLSVVPIILRTMQNNFLSRINRITLEYQSDDLLVTISEGDQEYKITAGLRGYVSNIVTVREEKYRVMAMAGLYLKEKGKRQLRLELKFCETASVRRMVFEPISDGKIRVKLSETPNNRLIERFLAEYSSQNSTVAFAKSVIERRFGENVISDKAKKNFTPEITAVKSTHPKCKELLLEMSRTEEPGGVKLIRSLLERFFKENDEEEKGRVGFLRKTNKNNSKEVDM